MRSTFTILVAVLVTTAFVGGFAGVTAGAQPASVSDHQCEFPVTLTDATGEEITLEEPPERITTTNPSAAQILWEFGAQDRVVGVTEFALYLDGAEEKTDVSAEGFGIDTEKVVGTEPDLVLAPNASAGEVESLRDAGLTVYHFPEATDVDDIADKTAVTGELVGECESADETNEWMYDNVEETQERTADFDRPDALYPLGSGYVAAGETFIDAIMTIGGTNNIASEEHQGYPQLSDEVVLEMDPELILVNDPEAAMLDEEPYASTTAGQEGSYVVMQVHYLNQPAPRSVVESTNTLADAVEELQASDEEPADAEETEDVEETPEEATETPTESNDANDDPDPSDDEVPGFGVVAAVLAALAVALVGWRR